MLKTVNNHADNITTFYLVKTPEGNTYTEVIAEANGLGGYNVPEDAVFGTTSVLLADMLLRQIHGAVVWYDPHDQTGVVITPSMYNVYRNEWLDFRATGVLPSKTFASIYKLLKFSCPPTTGMSYMTVDEFEDICTAGELKPNIRRYIKNSVVSVQMAGRTISANFNPDQNLLPSVFYSLEAETRVSFRRGMYPSLFKDLHDSVAEVSLRYVNRVFEVSVSDNMGDEILIGEKRDKFPTYEGACSNHLEVFQILASIFPAPISVAVEVLNW